MNDNGLADLTHFLFPDEPMGQVVLDQLHTGLTAERICRLKYKEKEEMKDLCLQIHKDRILVICNSNPETLPYELMDESEMESFCLQLFECENMKELYNHGIPALLMSKRKFEELKKSSCSSTLQMLSDCLAAETGDDVHSIQLARVMKCFMAEGELRLCTSSDSGWSFQKARFLGDHSSGWLLRMSSDPTKDWLIALPITKAQLCGSVTNWVLHSSAFLTPQ
ncbi:hypothetical protein [Paenibacillus pseudetheri]|uniref:Uncharacterized protein n=1 Tax=Paenibacillus pseudetheri TaxID=2897682 RepID=A0ABM9BLB1_9BACL|nr:hypothetical protein [Paenibacillus pseudetheri]CAH1059818.1 hypothetical protein PAECIP111894_06030 [Paenibacillus pseudetheri]